MKLRKEDLAKLSISELVERIEMHKNRMKNSERLLDLYNQEIWDRAKNVMTEDDQQYRLLLYGSM